MWCQRSKFLCKLSFTFALFLKMSKSKLSESISKSSDKEQKGDKTVPLSSKDYASIFEISSTGQLLRQCPMWETGFNEHSKTDD